MYSMLGYPTYNVGYGLLNVMNVPADRITTCFFPGCILRGNERSAFIFPRADGVSADPAALRGAREKW